MQFGYHHYHQRRHKHVHRFSVPNQRLAGFMDKSVYVVGALSVGANLPQLYNVWISHNVAGVSTISWTLFLVGTAFWLGYGLVHREKPISIINAMLVVTQGLIVLGLLIKR